MWGEKWGRPLNIQYFIKNSLVSNDLLSYLEQSDLSDLQAKNKTNLILFVKQCALLYEEKVRHPTYHLIAIVSPSWTPQLGHMELEP